MATAAALTAKDARNSEEFNMTNPLTDSQPDAHLSALLDKCLHETIARVRARGDTAIVEALLRGIPRDRDNLPQRLALRESRARMPIVSCASDGVLQL